MVYPRKDKIKQCIDFYFEIHSVALVDDRRENT